MPEQRIDITSVTLETILAMNGVEFSKEEFRNINNETTGVYIFYQTSPIQQIWYVGASVNLRERIRNHTFTAFFKLMTKAGCTVKVVWIEYPEQTKEELIAIESVFIRRLNPILNLQHTQAFHHIRGVQRKRDYKTTSDPLIGSDTKAVISVLSRDGVREQQVINYEDEDKIMRILSHSTIRELKKVASYCDVIGYSNMTKLELAIAIKESGKLTETQLRQIAPGAF